MDLLCHHNIAFSDLLLLKIGISYKSRDFTIKIVIFSTYVWHNLLSGSICTLQETSKYESHQNMNRFVRVDRERIQDRTHIKRACMNFVRWDDKKHHHHNMPARTRLFHLNGGIVSMTLMSFSVVKYLLEKKSFDVHWPRDWSTVFRRIFVVNIQQFNCYNSNRIQIN